MTKLYLTVVLFVLTYCAFIGWIFPFLISAKSDELPMIGLALMILLPIVFVLIGKSIYKQAKKQVVKLTETSKEN